MHIVGFVTAEEAKKLAELGYDVEDAGFYGLVSPSTESRNDEYATHTERHHYLMAKPEPGPDETQAIAVFVDASVYDLLKAGLRTNEDFVSVEAERDKWKRIQSDTYEDGSKLLERFEAEKTAHDTTKIALAAAERLVAMVEANSLDIQAWIARRDMLRANAAAMVADAENFKYCSHKHPDGSDARYPTGNGETACVCGNKWD